MRNGFLCIYSLSMSAALVRLYVGNHDCMFHLTRSLFFRKSQWLIRGSLPASINTQLFTSFGISFQSNHSNISCVRVFLEVPVLYETFISPSKVIRPGSTVINLLEKKTTINCFSFLISKLSFSQTSLSVDLTAFLDRHAKNVLVWISSVLTSQR